MYFSQQICQLPWHFASWILSRESPWASFTWHRHLYDLNQGVEYFPMKTKDIPSFGQFKNLIESVLELSSSSENRSQEFSNRNYFEKKVDLLLCEARFCLSLYLHIFWGIMKTINIYEEDVWKHMKIKDN